MLIIYIILCICFYPYLIMFTNAGLYSFSLSQQYRMETSDDKRSPQLNRLVCLCQWLSIVDAQGYSCECDSHHRAYDHGGMHVIHSWNHNMKFLDVTIRKYC